MRREHADSRAETPRSPGTEPADDVQAKEPPQPSPQFRRKAWREFQRAIDPLATPKPLPRPWQH